MMFIEDMGRATGRIKVKREATIPAPKPINPPVPQCKGDYSHPLDRESLPVGGFATAEGFIVNTADVVNDWPSVKPPPPNIGYLDPLPAKPSKLDELLKMPKVQLVHKCGYNENRTGIVVGDASGSTKTGGRFYRLRLRRLKERLIRVHYANLEAELSCKTEDEL